MYFKLILVAALATLATAQLNITLNANKTGFDVTGLEHPESRIINGAIARVGQFPWHVTIYSMLQPQTWSFCSGALISSTFVATYASAVRNSRETRVFLGSNRFGQGVELFSNNLFVHPKFNRDRREFNLAILRLNTRVNFNGAVRPIALLPFQLYNARFDGQFAVVSGFGSTQRTSPFSLLQFARLRVTNLDFCRRRFPSVAGRNFFCAMSYRQSVSARPGFGDVGSALVWRFANREYLIGMVTLGTPNAATEDGLTGFLNIGNLTPWIRSVIRRL